MPRNPASRPAGRLPSQRRSSVPRNAPRPAADDLFFRRLVQSMRNGVIAIRRDGTLALINSEAYRIFSLTARAEDHGRPFGEVFRERPDLVRVLSGTFDLATLPNRAELRLKDLDRVIGYTLSQVKDDDGRVIGGVMFFKDLTQVEQREERERLRDRLASLGEMAAGIAHELKNPLAGIEVMAGLLRRHVPASADAQSMLADIISESKLANAIVGEMLDFVRPIRLQVERTDVSDVLNQALTLAESQTTRGDVLIRLNITPNLPAIDGDQYQLCQVFTNLLINAFEALGGKGEITIGAMETQLEQDPALAGEPQNAMRVIVIDVADNGPGVPADLRDSIFNPFFTTKPKGSGLGLPIVRKIVDAHDGRIDLTGAPDGGARFRVTLPVSSSAAPFARERERLSGYGTHSDRG